MNTFQCWYWSHSRTNESALLLLMDPDFFRTSVFIIVLETPFWNETSDLCLPQCHLGFLILCLYIYLIICSFNSHKPLKLITLWAIFFLPRSRPHISVRLILSSICTTCVIQNDASFTFPADFTKVYDIPRSSKSLPPIRSYDHQMTSIVQCTIAVQGRSRKISGLSIMM